ELKSRLRAEALKRRDAIPPLVRKVKDRAISERLLSLEAYRRSKAVLFYVSFRSEAETRDLIIAALESGKAVLVPKVHEEDAALELYEIKGLDELAPGYMGIPEPEGRAESLRGIGDVDLVVVPGAAFDEKGNRLGYGKGYYDKLLSSEDARPSLVALAYEEQMVEAIPAEAHDIGIDTILTDRRVIQCGGNVNGQKED
ncbi:MAG: 5-formyltetrahydrofolate cyclo-ligase, partial [Nitrospirota bacterium]